MKARVKTTGMIVEVNKIVRGDGEWYYKDRAGFPYQEHHLDFDIPSQYDPDYWTRLEHQYAGMFLQAQISYGEQEGLNTEEMVEDAMIYAYALVEKLKEKEERK